MDAKVLTPQKNTSSTSSDCGNKNCPRHGHGAMMSSTRKPPAVNAPHTEDCKDKNCPRHGNRASATWNVEKPSSSKSISQRSSGPKQGDEIDDLVDKAKQYLRISAPVPKPGGSNNVMTFITTNNNSAESSYSSMSRSSSSVSPSPIKDGLSSSGMYDQMKMEHTLKENVVLQSITVKQSEEISLLKNRIKELESGLEKMESKLEKTEFKLEKAEEETIKMKDKNKVLVKLTQDWNSVLKEYQETIKNLKAKLRYYDLKAKQLKRMASDNAATASKWRAKVMEALEAQKDLEERKTASDKAAIGIYYQLREEKKKIVDLKRKHGVPLTDSDLDSTAASTEAGTLDTTMLESNSSQLGI